MSESHTDSNLLIRLDTRHIGPGGLVHSFEARYGRTLRQKLAILELLLAEKP